MCIINKMENMMTTDQVGVKVSFSKLPRIDLMNIINCNFFWNMFKLYDKSGNRWTNINFNNYLWVLIWMWCNVFKRPLQILMLSKTSRKNLGLLTHHPQKSIICRQHRSIVHYNFLVIVVGPKIKSEQCEWWN